MLEIGRKLFILRLTLPHTYLIGNMFSEREGHERTLISALFKNSIVTLACVVTLYCRRCNLPILENVASTVVEVIEITT